MLVMQHPADDPQFGEVHSLFNLNVIALNKAFCSLFNNSLNACDCNWTVLPLIGKAHNCSSLVYDLLKESGIWEHLGFFSRINILAKKAASIGAVVGSAATFVAAPIAYGLAERTFVNFFQGMGGTVPYFPRSPHHLNVFRDALRADNFELRGYSPLEINDFYGESSSYMSLMSISKFSWLLAYIADIGSHAGLALSITITLIAAGYISFAGLGQIVITPNDIAKFCKEINYKESNTKVNLHAHISTDQRDKNTNKSGNTAQDREKRGRDFEGDNHGEERSVRFKPEDIEIKPSVGIYP